MAAPSFTAAMLQAYENLTDVPPLWFDQVAEGEANAFPNAAFELLGEVPTYERVGRGTNVPGELTAAYEVCRCRFHFYDTLAAVDALAQMVKATFTPDVLDGIGIQGAVGAIALFRANYTLQKTGYRAKDGKAIYTAQIEYQCQIDYV